MFLLCVRVMKMFLMGRSAMFSCEMHLVVICSATLEWVKLGWVELEGCHSSMDWKTCAWALQAISRFLRRYRSRLLAANQIDGCVVPWDCIFASFNAEVIVSANKVVSSRKAVRRVVRLVGIIWMQLCDCVTTCAMSALLVLCGTAVVNKDHFCNEFRVRRLDGWIWTQRHRFSRDFF